MKTLLTLHLVELQPLALFIVFLTLLFLAVSWMFVVKSSRYKELQSDYSWAKEAFQRDILELTTEHKKELAESIKKLNEVQHEGNFYYNEWEKLTKLNTDLLANELTLNKVISELKASLPKPRERASDGKFAKGSDRLDNLRKHLMDGNRTDRYTAEEMFGIAHVGKFMARLKAEGFVVRKEKRRIAKDSFLTEYWFEAKKEARKWVAQNAE